MSQHYSLRRATIDDVDTIVHQRKRMIEEIKHAPKESLDLMGESFAVWVGPKIESGDYLEWFAITDSGAIVAGAGLWLLDWPPYILPSGAPAGQRAYLLNVYTEEPHRKRGLSRMVVSAALEWSRSNNISVVSLHASPYGKPLYESLDFQPSTEMRLFL